MLLSLKTAARRLFPVRLRGLLRYAVDDPGWWRRRLHLARVRGQVWGMGPGSVVRCRDYTVRISNGPYYYFLYKDIFLERIYHFDAPGPDPLILDCGSNIGMALLYFKHVYPKARIIAFEPDPTLLPHLQENIAQNGLTDVELVPAALANRETPVTFYSDGVASSCLAGDLPVAPPRDWQRHEVPCVRLRDYLAEPVDFLKMNIEGAEYAILADSADRLRMIREMVVEYHHVPDLPRTIHDLLALLHDQGFEYLVNDFDSETNQAVRPPFCLRPETRYYLLIYARRRE